MLLKYMKLSNKKYIRPLRIVIAFLPIVWILSKIDYDKLSSAIVHTAWWTLPAIIAITYISMLVQAHRWWFLIHAFNRDLPFIKAVTIHFKGLFYSIITPTSAGQDIIRAAILSKEHDYRIVWGASWICRLFGLFASALLSIYGIYSIDKGIVPSQAITIISISFFSVCALILLSFTKGITRLLRPAFLKFLPEKLKKIAVEIREGIYIYKEKKRELIIVFIITFLLQFIIITNSCFLILGISGTFPFLECLAFLPIIEIICITLPLTPNGIGVREALLAIFFSYLGLSNEQLGVYIGLGFISIALKITGGIPVFLDLINEGRYRSTPQRNA
ncbi:MAG: flippase-like domain-containing protein [Chitinivibrionales bacterium]|nr:flippase-like domain-containing protein [Chitinivibrionales bacterium]